jgi:hypothetical protein
MASLASLATLLLATSASANTISFNIGRNAAAESAQLERRQLERSTAPLFKRAGTVAATLTNAEAEGLYFANITVGTPGQALSLQIDTGSSDVWVPASSATQCRSAQNGGCPNGECKFIFLWIRCWCSVKICKSWRNYGKEEDHRGKLGGDGCRSSFLSNTNTQQSIPRNQAHSISSSQTVSTFRTWMELVLPEAISRILSPLAAVR